MQIPKSLASPGSINAESDIYLSTLNDILQDRESSVGVGYLYDLAKLAQFVRL